MIAESLAGKRIAITGATGFVGTALAWSLWFGLVAAGEAGRAASYIFFVPLVGVVVGAVLLDESLTLSLLVGAALVVLGVYLVNRRPRSRGTTERPRQDSSL